MRAAAGTTPARPEALRELLARALALHRAGDADAAIDAYIRVLAIDPEHADALNLLGVLALARGDAGEAEAVIRRAVAARPEVADYHANLGRALLALGRNAAAADALGAAASRAPENVDLLRLHALACRRAGRSAAAVASLRRAARRAPVDGAVLAELARALHHSGATEAAVAAYRQALAAGAEAAETHNNLGVALVEAGAPGEALPHYRAALAVAPSAEGHSNLARALHALGRAEPAAAHYKKALALAPANADILNNFGNLRIDQGRLGDGLALYEQALAAAPGHDHALVSLLAQASRACDWGRQAALLAELRARLPAIARAPARWASLVPLSFTLPYFCSDAALIGQVCRLVGGHFARTAGALVQTRSPGGEDPERRLRIGYLSPDFGDHPIGHVTRPIYALHDRDRYHVTCYATLDRSAAGGAYLDDIRAGADRFVDVSALSHAEAARRIAADGTDVLVDLCGYMRHARPQILALRPAPVQVYWQGHSGTLGAPYIDYMVGDPVVTPAAEDDRFSEAVIRLPEGFSSADRHPIADAPETRAAHGLPADAVVLCAFNNPLKISAETFAAWMEILAAVPAAVLWLSAPAEAATGDALKAAAARSGVDPARLVFAARIADKRRHLARHRLADLFVDTFAFNASTTALDALWAGLPVLTRRGTYATARLAASYLTTLGLDELIAGEAHAYVATAIALARDGAARRRLAANLAERRDSSPLFDAARFVGHLEAGFRAAWRRWCAGLAPAALDIAATSRG